MPYRPFLREYQDRASWTPWQCLQTVEQATGAESVFAQIVKFHQQSLS